MDFSQEELSEYIVKMGLPKFRAKQIYEWIIRGVKDFDEMTNLSKDLREKLKEDAYTG